LKLHNIEGDYNRVCLKIKSEIEKRCMLHAILPKTIFLDQDWGEAFEAKQGDVSML
jgi:hypothetical protein